jgi:hypothetical protein
MRRSNGFASTWPRRAGRCFPGKSSWLGRYLVSTPFGTATVLSFALTTGSESNAKFYDFAFRLGILVVPSPEAGTATRLDGPSGCPSSSKPRAARQGGGR